MNPRLDTTRTLSKLHPHIATLWHPTKNGSLTPDDVGLGGRYKAWWLGKDCKHEWDALVSNMVSGQGCPICSGRRILIGFNDMETTHPEHAAEWHPTKNGTLTPREVTAGSGKEVWWLGKDCGHEWDKSRIATRCLEGTGCPICSGRRILIGFNDIGTTRPLLAGQWHPTKNGTLTPREVTAGTSKKVWWLCARGHEWKSSISNRANGSGCPQCPADHHLIPGVNDMQTTHPKVAAQWHPTKNGSLRPEDFSAASNMRAWWVGECKHTWNAIIGNRTNRHSGCPYCNGKIVQEGETDLYHKRPDVAIQWHPTKNETLSPSEITVGSHTIAWWMCGEGHEWRATVKDRTRLDAPTGCPTCAIGFSSSKDEQGLATVIKDLIGEDKVLTNVRKVISSEIDVYVPHMKLAFEFNGLYWHSESNGKGRYYHADKSQACAEKEIQLIHVWEDDWRERRDIVVRGLASRMGATERLNDPGVLLIPDAGFTRRYGARTLVLEVVNHQESAVFLKENHIQGGVHGTLHVGLKERTSGTLRAVFVAKRSGNKNHIGEWNIERYATHGIVPGGFTRLMKFAEKVIAEQELGIISKWVTFSDTSISDGGLYSSHGFIRDKLIPPDYMYTINQKRYHKFGYRIEKFKRDPTLKYAEGMTEKQLAALNNIHRIWDAGKIRWVRAV